MIIYKEMIIYHGHLIEFNMSEEDLSNIITNLETIVLNDITYCNTKDSIFGLNCECEFIFQNDKLTQIKFMPILKEYEHLIHEFNVTTMHEAFENAYVYLYSSFENNKCFSCIYKDKYNSWYNSNLLSINISFDSIKDEITISITKI